MTLHTSRAQGPHGEPVTNYTMAHGLSIVRNQFVAVNGPGGKHTDVFNMPGPHAVAPLTDASFTTWQTAMEGLQLIDQRKTCECQRGTHWLMRGRMG